MFIERIDAEAEIPVLWPPHAKNWLIGKDPDAGKDWRQEEKGMTDDEMVGWHHWLNRQEAEQALGVGGGQGSLAHCSLWGRSQTRLSDWIELNWDTNCLKHSISLMNNNYLHGISSPITVNMPNMPHDITCFGDVKNDSFNLIGKDGFQDFILGFINPSRNLIGTLIL